MDYVPHEPPFHRQTQNHLDIGLITEISNKSHTRLDTPTNHLRPECSVEYRDYKLYNLF
jgi:hypothetical protein